MLILSKKNIFSGEAYFKNHYTNKSCLMRILVLRHSWSIFLRIKARSGRYVTLTCHVKRSFVLINWRTILVTFNRPYSVLFMSFSIKVSYCPEVFKSSSWTKTINSFQIFSMFTSKRGHMAFRALTPIL